MALLNAMLNVIISEGMADIQYVQAHTEGFEALKKKVEDFTPEKMAPVCGIPADDHPRGGAALCPFASARSSSGAWASRSTPTAPTTRAA